MRAPSASLWTTSSVWCAMSGERQSSRATWCWWVNRRIHTHTHTCVHSQARTPHWVGHACNACMYCRAAFPPFSPSTHARAVRTRRRESSAVDRWCSPRTSRSASSWAHRHVGTGRCWRGLGSPMCSRSWITRRCRSRVWIRLTATTSTCWMIHSPNCSASAWMSV
jgi:hypothetical protein